MQNAAHSIVFKDFSVAQIYDSSAPVTAAATARSRGFGVPGAIVQSVALCRAITGDIP